jgi:hypothetical protein
MARQQSSSELAGSLAATLTPSAPRASEPPPHVSEDENSGLFDVGALYAETFNEVMRRARSDARLGSLVRAALPAAPAAARWSRPAPAFEPPPSTWPVPIELTIPVEAPRSRGLGWFGVAVAWLATVTMGASIATTVPGHALTRLRTGVPVTAVATSAPHSQAGSLPTAPLPVTAGAVMPAPVMPAVVMPVPVAPVPSPALAPLAMASSERPIAAQADAPRVSTKKVLPRAVTSVAHARPAAPSASAATAPPSPAIAAAPRPTAPSRPAPAPTSASTAGMSLDELIRHEVQVESAKHH